MCEFKDKDGVVIRAGDIIERWNRSSREWQRYQVEEVRMLETVKTVYGPAPDYKRLHTEPSQEVSLKAYGEVESWRDKDKKEWSRSPSRLKKNADIRKAL